jgi:prepilin-type N-terminal cleavage/methylation domain-containing protein
VKDSKNGLTLVEVLVALVVLAIGIVALTGSSALVTRMIGRGKVETRAALMASGRVEMLRVAANSTSPRCTSSRFVSGGPITTGGLTESWVVPPTGRVRTVRVTVTYRTARGSRSAVLESGIPCQ